MNTAPPINEEYYLEFWEKEKIAERLQKQLESAEEFTIWEGPPFATGTPHHGHIFTGTVKDIFQRWASVTGHRVDRTGGWDCHGLPIEHEINKQLNMQADEAVKKLGVKGYNDECRSIVQRYRAQWLSTLARMGRWMDFENDYKTMDKDYMESVWWVFRQLWDKELIYQGTKVMPFSTSLETPLSNFEAGSNYQSVQDPAVTVLFKLQNQDEYVSIWTTTPWTLPSNQAIAVSPALEYALIECPITQHKTWVCKDNIASIFCEDITPIKTQMGEDLVGLKYEPLYPSSVSEPNHTILAADFIEAGTGTGLVHMAPAFGEDDNRLCKEHGIDTLICPIDFQGKFTADFTMCQGQYIKDADKQIIKDLKQRNHIAKHDVVVHNYPFCPRSDTPLIYMAVPSWFMAVTKIQSRIIAGNQETNWVPAHVKEGRFGKWLASAKDWALSRNRVWGTPIPIWINDTSGKAICMESIEMLATYSGITVDDLHREHVDPISFSVDGEDGTYHRVPEVLDCWFESGAMPYAKLHYPFENQKVFENNFPAQFIAEGLDQTRGWFYTLMVLSTALFDKPAFENVIVGGIVMADDGKKMSKRLRNYTPPDELISTYGADALRLYLISSNLVKGEELRFNNDGVEQVNRTTIIPLINALKFFKTYADIDQYSHTESDPSQTALDQWILSRLQTLKALVAKNMAEYKLYMITPQILRFVDELTNTYIRMNRNRFWGSEVSADKAAAYQTLYDVLFELAHILAPFAPYTAEHLDQSLKAYDHANLEDSVHLRHFPAAQEALIDHDLEQAVENLQDILNMGRAKRVEKNIRIKTPLAQLTIIHPDANLLASIQKFDEKIKQELNIKSISYSQDEGRFVALSAKPNLPLIGRKLGKKLPAIRTAILNLSTEEIKAYESSGSIQIEDELLEGEALIIERKSQAGMDAVSSANITIVLDTMLTPELEQEGLARELISQIQKTRKQLNFKVEQRIAITLYGSEQLQTLFKEHGDHILREVLGTQWEFYTTEQQHAFEGIEGSFTLTTT